MAKIRTQMISPGLNGAFHSYILRMPRWRHARHMRYTVPAVCCSCQMFHFRSRVYIATQACELSQRWQIWSDSQLLDCSTLCARSKQSHQDTVGLCTEQILQGNITLFWNTACWHATLNGMKTNTYKISSGDFSYASHSVLQTFWVPSAMLSCYKYRYRICMILFSNEHSNASRHL